MLCLLKNLLKTKFVEKARDFMKIPEGVSVKISDSAFTVSGSGGSLSKKFDSSTVKLEGREGEVIVSAIGKVSRKRLAAVNAVNSHLQNMFTGVAKGFLKKLSIVYAHFPISIEVKGGAVLIKNFLGEKSPRSAKIVGSTQVKADKQEVLVSGIDKEAVGQTAANMVQAVRIRHKDLRVFQDGIYLVE